MNLEGGGPVGKIEGRPVREIGISLAFTNFGGNVAAMGTKPDGSPWRIGIRHLREDNGLIGAISVVGKSVITSGDYQRYFFGKDGKRYHHGAEIDIAGVYKCREYRRMMVRRTGTTEAGMYILPFPLFYVYF